MAKKGGKKKKGGAKGAKTEKVVVETTKEMEKERAMYTTTGLPLGYRFSMNRKAESIRAEVSEARLKTCMLKKTESLNLRGLALESVPEQIGWGVPPFEDMWLSLVDLDLSHNGLFKSAEVFAAVSCLGAHLKRLDLSANALAGEVPAVAGSLVALESLRASENQLTGIHEEAARGWAKLASLNLARNAVAALPSSSGSWQGLTHLDLRNNNLKEIVEAAAAAWTLLEVVKLGANKLEAIPEAVGKWGSLRALYVTDNKIPNLPLEIGQCSKLETLHCGVNLLKELPADLFGKSPAEGDQDADGAPAESAATPEATPRFPACLREIELYRNKLTLVPDDLGHNMPGLEQLSLSGNSLKYLPSGLNKCTGLRELHLANNAKLVKIPDELASLTKLRYVNLAGCQGLKAIPNALANAWLELREIDIRSGAKKEKCKLTAEWVAAAAGEGREKGFILRGGIPPKMGKKGKK
mmetsp:Transcript_578/g.1254  ORF Transcript_578/g.1254 Transcript_578/m.1254 type:complete len:468 (+) Transcript_578:288-1691(+)|eukprot:CAMPEP_0172626328 /NCGR_PEP_ID=MMETSP1068-20121228/149661_1 /TAXON_ID=35684 /ORGANISM="Pseudopedinella elastica, Strain CCMP716" /LENGTH=467 /DNA_ID=CAMNT_0013435917 /DNA_START=70 /DNA_END=1473 /DNA_ORIENTATION=-